MEPYDLLDQALTLARRQGADAADVIYAHGSETTVSWRLGKTEGLERSESAGLGVRVFVGKQQATVSTSDISAKALAETVERAVAMARVAPPDPYARLARKSELATDFPDLALHDATEPTAEQLMEAAAEAEAAALEVKGITNSEGADASHSKRRRWMMTSEGFRGDYAGSTHSLSVSVIGGEGTEMQRDYDYAVARHASDLPAPSSLGKEAARRTLARLNPSKVPTGSFPVVFDPRVGRQLLGQFSSAINGASVARGTSFLKEKRGQRIFSPTIRIMDDPLRPRGLASHPFDGEGVAVKALALVEEGVLNHWFLDLATAAQLEIKGGGHASRGLGGPPSPSASNLYIEAGDVSPAALMADIQDGLYITETFGMGVNLVTGDYSQGAAGFRIEKGNITHPVNEITIAGHLLAMFEQLQAANDLEFRTSTNTPTLRVGVMTVAGA